MTTVDTIKAYMQAIHGGGWEDFVAEDFTFVVNTFDRSLPGKAAYLKGAGDFFRTTTSVESIDLIVDGSRVALTARYGIRSPKGETGFCDVAEFIEVKDDKLVASSIFFDTKALGEFMAG